ncbi:MAG: DNA polymerase III subunit chi [Pseudomonadota bacterium]
MTQVLFYHLTATSMAEALPTLVEKCLDREWTVAIQAVGQENARQIDDLLWSYKPESFLVHANDDDDASEADVLVTAEPNKGVAHQIRFLLDGAPLPQNFENHTRLMIVFDGQDEEKVALARDQWRELKPKSHDLTYYKQTEEDRWERNG